MKHLILSAVGFLSLLSLSAQDRYLEEVFTNSEITVMEDVVYGINVNPLLNTSLLNPAYVQANAAQITSEKDSLLNWIATDPSLIPLSFFLPVSMDSSTILKVTQLRMDVYMPSNSVDTETERPVMVFVHTGNFLPPVVNGSYGGSKNDSVAVNICSQWAKRGFVAVAPNYRHGWNPLAPGEAGLVTRRATLLNAVYRAIHDVQFAIKGMRLDATMGSNTYGIDPDKIGMMGSGSGGYVALAYNTLDKQEETALDKFVFGGNSVIQPAIVGDINGNGGLINLYVDNGMSSDVDICVNLGGCLGDISWLEAGDGPFVTFHSPFDNFAPFDTGTVIVPTTGDDVVDVNGPNTFIPKANGLGLNDAYAGEYPGDAFTARARYFYGRDIDDSPIINVDDPIEIPADDMEGLFTVIVRDGNGDIEQNGTPWDWWSKTDLDALVAQTNMATGGNYDSDEINSNSLLTNPNQSRAQGLVYIDTIMGYSIPRIVKTMQIGNWESVDISELYVGRKDVVLFPNPTSDILTVRTNNPSTTLNAITVTDQLGRTIVDRKELMSNTTQLDLEGLDSGVYILNATFEDGSSKTHQFLVQ